MSIPALRWVGPPQGPAIDLLDQTRLPGAEIVIRCADVPALVEAIQRLAVRGAPLLGVAGAYGVALAALRGDDVPAAAAMIAAARPTAVNLAWGTGQALTAWARAGGGAHGPAAGPARPGAATPDPAAAGGATATTATATSGTAATTGGATAGGATTGRATTGRATTGRATEGGATSGRATAGRATTGRATTGRVTAGRATGGRATAGRATTGRVTAGGAGAGAGEAALARARAIAGQDAAASAAIAAYGLDLVPPGGRVLTHCNTGALVSAGEGTAFAVILAAHRAGRLARLWVDETRPLLQGARLTAYEAARAGIDHAVLADGAAASLMGAGQVDLVITGADRIVADGSVANKVGTYSLAVLARYHQVPFVVAAPVSTIDLDTPAGSAIPVEQRAPEEVTTLAGQAVAPPGTAAYNPAFDVTPPDLITAIVTERGVLKPVTAGNLRVLGAGPEKSAGPGPPPTWDDEDHERSRACRR